MKFRLIIYIIFFIVFSSSSYSSKNNQNYYAELACKYKDTEKSRAACYKSINSILDIQITETSNGTSSLLNIAQYLSEPVYFSNDGSILLDENYKKNDDLKDLYVFAPLNNSEGYYLGFANFTKYLLTVGSKGYVWHFNETGKAQKCSFKAKSKSSREWNKGKIYVNCPNKQHYKGTFIQSYNGNTGEGTVNYCFNETQNCTGNEISFSFNSMKHNTLKMRDDYINDNLKTNVNLNNLLVRNCSNDDFVNKIGTKCKYLTDNKIIKNLNKKESQITNLQYTEVELDPLEEEINNAIAYACKYKGTKKLKDDCKKLLKNKSNPEIIASSIKKEKKNIAQTINPKKDLVGPEIKVYDTFEAGSDLLALIKGSITDDSEIVQVTIDDDLIALANGNFSQKLYVKPNGQNIIITAMDKFGNQSSKTIQLKRSTQKTITKIFEDLNPTIIRGKINSSSVALIIGVEDYQSTFSAPYATNDAVTFNDFANTSLGVPQQNIKLLMNNEAGRADTLRAVAKWLPKVVMEDRTDIYIFFSGHGLASDDGEDLYLLPSDGDPEMLEDTTLLRNQLFDRIAKLNPRSVTVFLDTCYSGATRTDEFLVAAKPIFIEAQEQDIPAKFTVFSASAGRETAKVLPEAQHGLFSYYMMKGLEGEADANSDNQITNGELIAFINKNVSRQANQTPQLNGNPDQVLVQW